MFSSRVAVGSKVKELKQQLTIMEADARRSKQELEKSNKRAEELAADVKKLEKTVAEMKQDEHKRMDELQQAKDESKGCNEGVPSLGE